MTRPPAPALTPLEAARVDAAPVPPEVVVETVARWLAEQYGEHPVRAIGPWRQDAAALLDLLAIAALPPSPAEEAVKRVARLADELQWLVDDETVDETGRVAHAWTLHRLRAALASPAPAPQGEEGQG